MRKHIARAIKASSKALRRALEKYNDAAKELGDRPELTWEEILEMGSLEDFDLLRLACEDIRGAAWAQPGARAAMDLHFKLLRAEEERTRLNVEIKRFATWMEEESDFLLHHEARLHEANQPAHALQVQKYLLFQGRFYDNHDFWLKKINELKGFTSSITPGVGVCKIRRDTVRERRAVSVPPRDPHPTEQAPQQRAAQLTQALEASARAELAEYRDDGGAKEADDDTDDEAEVDDRFQVVLQVVEDDEPATDNEGEPEEGA
jgi:hypothetical protein